VVPQVHHNPLPPEGADRLHMGGLQEVRRGCDCTLLSYDPLPRMLNSYGSLGDPAFVYRFLFRSVNGPMRPQRIGGRSSQRRTVPTQLPFVLTGASEIGSFISAVEILTLARAGFTPLKLTPAEVIRSEETPGLTWGDACGLFGGCRRAEWTECQKIPGYRDKTFLCADHRAQPFLPTGIGEPGLILCPPTGSYTPEDDNVAFQVLSCSPQDNLLYYQGEYTKVPLRQIQVSFCDLPTTVSCRTESLLMFRKYFSA
jgi:hypothetical protein